MKRYFVDLHVHIGRSSEGREIKKATAGNLTFENIAHESYYKKGIDIIGVVDCISPFVLDDIDRLMDMGELTEKPGGGLVYRGGQSKSGKVPVYQGEQTILLGAEIETHEEKGCSAHCLCFFQDLAGIKAFAGEMCGHMKNIRACSSMSRLTGQELFDIVDEHGGVFIPAHAFTPHKSFYGSCCDSLHDIFDDKAFGKIPAVELGLSADSMMASQLSELDGKSFISNSDAHSLIKMGREYNIFRMKDASFDEALKALKGEEGRAVEANYGLDPRLGKYHRTYCLICDKVVDSGPPVLKCPVSDRHSVVVGVKDRLSIIRDRETPEMSARPSYHYQVPLEFIPKVGPKTIDRLIRHFGSEMKILHEASFDELAGIVKEDIAKNILLAREGKLGIAAGGGGIYGRIGTPDADG